MRCSLMRGADRSILRQRGQSRYKGKISGDQPMRHGFRGTIILAAALMLAGCDRQAQTSVPQAPNAASTAKSTDAKTVVSSDRMVIKPQFDQGERFAEGMAAVRIGAKFGYIDKQGKVVIMPQFDFAGTFSEGVASVGIGNKIGYIDKEGHFVVTPSFEIANLLAVSERLAAVRVGEFLTGKWGYIDKQGKIVIRAQYEGAGPFSDGLAAVSFDGKWGYIDKQGTTIIKPQYSSVRSFSEGLAAVRVGDYFKGKDGSICTTGTNVIET